MFWSRKHENINYLLHSAKTMGDNIGKIMYQNYPTTRFCLQHSGATWTRTVLTYQGAVYHALLHEDSVTGCNGDLES